MNLDKAKIALLYLVILGNFVLLVAPGFAGPAMFYYDETLLLWSTAGISHMVWGLGVTKGQIALFTGNWASDIFPLMGRTDALQVILERTLNASAPVFMGRYPPGIGLTLYLFFVTFGLQFWVARLATTIFHVGTLILFPFNLYRHTRKYSLALIGGLLFSSVPMSSYFGRLVEPFIPALFFMTLSATFYSSSFHEENSVRRLGPALASLCVACFYNWVGFLLFVVVIALELARTNRSLKGVLACAIVMLSMLVFLVLPLATLGVSLGDYKGSNLFSNLVIMFRIFIHRTFLTSQDDSGLQFSRLQESLVFVRVNIWAFTLLVPALAVCGLLTWIRRTINHVPLSYAERVNGILCAVGVMWVLLMAQGVYVHMYYQYFLLPGEVFFASAFLDRLLSANRGFCMLTRILVIGAIVAIYYLSVQTICGNLPPIWSGGY